MTCFLRSAQLRSFGALLGLALLSACAGQPKVDQSQEAQQYQARAAHNYEPPGPPQDPWGPYIDEAAARFDVPDPWIRAVMRVESGGRLYEGEGLITSPVGAMGLMQVMPETYDGLRERYSLGDDAYDPHNNILAGTAYVREMYDLYGSPGFLAAYNAGPARLDDYLANRRGLPAETRHYVAKAGPSVLGIFPERRSPADGLAMNDLPIDIAPGLRYGRPHPEHSYAQTQSPHYGQSAHGRSMTARERERERGRGHEVQVAQLPEPPRAPGHSGATTTRLRLAASSRTSGGFHLIAPAMAETVPGRQAGGGWGIQVGAFGNESQARQAADAARGAGGGLGHAHSTVGAVRQSHATLYRARLTGLSRDGATQACEHLARGRCIVLSPAAQF